MPYPGIDIIEIERFGEACQRHPKLLERLFTERENLYLENKGLQSRAARFAAKEAVLKALGCGLRGLSWHDIEILSEASGEPVVYLSEKAAQILEKRGGTQIRISLSHDRSKAVAMAILD